MADPVEILRNAKSILVIDYPTPDVPQSLARAGLDVVAHEGPSDDEYYGYTVDGTDVIRRKRGLRPEHVDVVYEHRPVGELPGIVQLAVDLGARAVWHHSGLDAGGVLDPKGCWMSHEESRRAREIVEGAGLEYVEAPYIGDAAARVTHA